MQIGDWAATPDLKDIYREIRELGLETNLAELEAFGFTVIEGALSPDEVEATRDKIIEISEQRLGRKLDLDSEQDYEDLTFIPFLLVFASAAKLHFEGPEETGFLARLVVPAAILGFFTTAVSIVLAVLPPPDATDRALAIVKILGGTAVLLAAGATVYLRGRKGGSGEAGAQAAQ